MSIVLVRHGETLGNRARVLQKPDIPLSEDGIRQAERLAARLASLGAKHILASDLLRAQMTAAPIAAATGLAIETSPLLAERNFGDLRGTPYADLPHDPFIPGFAPPGGESWEAFYERVARAFALICERRAALDGHLIVVTHGLVCRAILERHVAGLGTCTPISLDNTSVTILSPAAPYEAELINCCAHLADPHAPSPTRGGIA